MSSLDSLNNIFNQFSIESAKVFDNCVKLNKALLSELNNYNEKLNTLNDEIAKESEIEIKDCSVLIEVKYTSIIKFE